MPLARPSIHSQSRGHVSADDFFLRQEEAIGRVAEQPLFVDELHPFMAASIHGCQRIRPVCAIAEREVMDSITSAQGAQRFAAPLKGCNGQVVVSRGKSPAPASTVHPTQKFRSPSSSQRGQPWPWQRLWQPQQGEHPTQQPPCPPALCPHPFSKQNGRHPQAQASCR